MAANEETLGKLQVQIEANLKKVTFDMDKLKKFVSQRAEEMEKEFRKKKMRFDDTLMKKSVTELIALRKKLQTQFAERVKLNFDVQSIKQSRDQLAAVDRALDGVGVSVDKAQSKFVTGFKKIAGAIGLTFGLYQLTNFIKASTQAFIEEEKSIRKLDTALGYHSANLIRYSTELQKVTTYGDDQIIEVQARIAAFTKEETAIKALTAATLDMATAKGMDLVQAGDLISKTFGASVNALSRYGIEVEGAAGSTERLQSITEGITKLWGGQASAALDTMGGKLENLNQQLNDQQEEIGGAVLPAWLLLNKAFNAVVTTLVNSGKLMRQEIDRNVLAINNLFTGQISFWDFLTGKIETTEQRMQRLGKFLMLTYTSGATTQAQDVQLKGYSKIVKEIEELNEKLTEENLSLEEAEKIQNRINELTKQITFGTEKQNNAIDEIIKKLQTENEIRALTYTLSTDILEASRAMLEAQLAIVTTDEDRLKILREIKRVEEEIARISPDFSIEELDSGTFAEDLNKEIAKGIEDKQAAEAEALSYLQELRLQNMGSEFDEREARINAEYDYLLEKYSDNAEIITEIEKAREKDLAILSRERFSASLSAAQNIANALRNIFGDTSLIRTFTQVLSIVESIAAIIQSLGILGAIFGGPAGAVAALKGGGSFLNGKVTPYSQIPKFAGGINFKVPPRYVNDSFLMRVSAGENVNVTPKAQVMEQEKFLAGINQKLNILNSNFVESTLEKTKQGAIPLFGKLEGKDIFISNKRSGKVIGRMT